MSIEGEDGKLGREQLGKAHSKLHGVLKQAMLLKLRADLLNLEEQMAEVQHKYMQKKDKLKGFKDQNELKAKELEELREQSQQQ